MELEISIVSENVRDFVSQQHLRELVESLGEFDPLPVPAQADQPPEGATPKSDTYETVIGAVKISVPAAAAAKLLGAWIKSHYSTRAARTIEIKEKGGRSLVIKGFDEKEISRFFSESRTGLPPGDE